jgi:hypothetical protein
MDDWYGLARHVGADDLARATEALAHLPDPPSLYTVAAETKSKGAEPTKTKTTETKKGEEKAEKKSAEKATKKAGDTKETKDEKKAQTK